MKNPFSIWFKAVLLLLLCQGGFLPVLSAAPAPPPADICELPPPDSAWVVGATYNSITVGWTAVPGAYSYRVAVANLDGGGAPPPQYILDPTTEATFNNLLPGRYQFDISATACDGGDYGQSRPVYGGTAIIITDIIAEACTPMHENLPANNNMIKVCIPYGNSPDEAGAVSNFRIVGRYDPPGSTPDSFTFVIEFSMMMPCAGSFAFTLDPDNSQNVVAEVIGGYGTPFPSIVKFHPRFGTYQYDNVDLATISGVRWWSTPPNPDQNNGCTDEYNGSYVLRLIPEPGYGTALFLTAKDTPWPYVGTSGSCQGKIDNPEFLCLYNNPNYRIANPNGGLDEAVPFDWETGLAVELRVAPNPFGRRTEIGYRLEKDAPLDLALYDAFGRRVRTLEQSNLAPAGVYRAELDAGDLPSGLYYLVLQTDRDRQIAPVVKNE